MLLELEKTASPKRPSSISDLLYGLLNLFLAVAAFLLIRYLHAPWLALLLVVLGKWRVFSVKISYWWVNIQSNLVDFIVGAGYVGLLTLTNHPSYANLVAQIGLAVAYGIWLLVIKPQSKQPMVLLQAGAALLVGYAVLFSFSGSIPLVLTTILAFVIAYAAARHVLSHTSISKLTFFSVVFGFIMTQLAWVYAQWTIGYPIRIIENFKLPQAAIILTVFGHLLFVLFDQFVIVTDVEEINAKNRSIRDDFQQILIPLVFDIAIIIILTAAFARPIFGRL